jgi:multidrug resistance efflux pump
VDPSRLARLKSEVELAKVEQKKRRDDLQLAKNLEQLAKEELDRYREMLIAGLKGSLHEAEARIKELTVAHQQSKRELDMNRRSGAGVSRDERSKSEEHEAMARDRLQQAEACRDRIVNEIKAAEQNHFYHHDPIYLTWHLQSRLSIPQLEHQLKETEERLAITKAELEQVEKHASELAGSTIRSPLAGVVWRRNASWGPVAKGESLLEIAQSQGQFIQAHFSESHARSLYPGARAVILFSGLEPFEGTVRAVRQPSPTDHDYEFAIRLPRRLNQLEVLIDFDTPPSDATLLGRQCQVLVADASSRAHGWAAKLFCLLRW